VTKRGFKLTLVNQKGKNQVNNRASVDDHKAIFGLNWRDFFFSFLSFIFFILIIFIIIVIFAAFSNNLVSLLV